MKIILMITVIMLMSLNLISQERYVLKCPPEKAYTQEEFQEILNDMLGKGENEINNRGDEIDEWARLAGLPNPKNPKAEGWAWCQIKTTAARIMAGFLPYPKTALANAPFNYAKKYGQKTLCKPQIGDEQKWIYPGKGSGHNEDVVKIFKNGNTLNNAGNVGQHSRTNDAKRSKVCLIQRTPGKPIGKMRHRGYDGFDFC